MSSGLADFCRVPKPHFIGMLGSELWIFSTRPCLIQQSDSQNHQPFTAFRRDQNDRLVYLDELRFRLCDA